MSIYRGDESDNAYQGGKNGKTAGVFRKFLSVAVILVLVLTAATACDSARETSDAVEVMASESGSAVETTGETTEAVTEETTASETTTVSQETEESGTTAPPAGENPGFQFEDTGDTKYAYLTFDDGPSENTYPILDILDQYGVKATFFTIGKTDGESVERYKAIVDRGHALGMHSYTHVYSEIYASLDSFQADTQRIHDWLYQVTGQDVRLYRFPGGSSNTVSCVDMRTLIDYVTSMGYIYYDWNVSSGDASSSPVSAEQIIQNIMSQSEGYTRIVVLMHDAAPKTETVRALPGIIENLQNAGYQIVPITDATKPIQHVKADYMQ